jgi:transcriptional regulator with XRE-family HTH domain
MTRKQATDKVDKEMAYEVRKWRMSLGLSQKDLAEAMGRSQHYVAWIEQGSSTPNLRTLRRLADAMGLNLIVKFELKSSHEKGKEAHVPGPESV